MNLFEEENQYLMNTYATLPIEISYGEGSYLFDKNNNDLEIIDEISSSFNIEDLIIKDEEWKSIWNFIKKKKNQDVQKVFYLYYKEEMTIKEISKLLNIKESYIKNLIYRTLNELCLYFKECD